MHSVPITGQLNGGVEIAQKWIVPCSAFNKLCSTGKSPQLFEPVLYQVQNGGNYRLLQSPPSHCLFSSLADQG